MSIVEIMRELHRLRKHAHELRQQIERAPRTIEVQRAKVTREERSLKAAKDALQNVKKSNMDKELTLKSTHVEMVKKKAYLNAAADTKAYKALDTEIKNASALCAKLEEEILAGMAAVEEQTAKLPELEKTVAKAKEDFATFERTAGERVAAQRQLLEQAQAKLKEVEATIPESVRPTYTKLTAAHDDDGMAAVQGKTCVGCATEMTSQMQNDLLSGRLVLCKSCGRILYLTE
jgi:uncharacterized protein